MARIRAITQSSGGGGNSPVVDYDSNNLIHSITSQNASWAATDDCVMTGSYYSSNAYSCNIFVNSKMLIYGKDGTFGYQGTGLFIKKGDVITTNDVGTYNLSFYGIA